MVAAPIILPVSATITHSARARAAYDQVLEQFSRPLKRRSAEQYHFGQVMTALDGVDYNFYFSQYDDALPAWHYPDLTAHVAYLGEVVRATLQDEMRAQAQFLKANDHARSAIKNSLEAPDLDLDSMIRSIRQNGNTLSKQLKKRYPVLVDDSIGDEVLRCFVVAFEGLEH